MRKIAYLKGIMSLKFNPFRPNSLINPGIFKGRSKELNEIEKILFQTMHGNPQHFLLEGERGIGKSSLMLYVEALASGKIAFQQQPNLKPTFLVISVELSAAMTAEDIIIEIARRFKDQVARHDHLKSAAKKAWELLSNWEILGVRYHKQQAPENDALEILNSFCERVAEFVKSTELKESGKVDGVIILVDEADKPEPTARLGEIVKLFAEKMTRLGRERVTIALAGLPVTLDKLKASHESSPRLFKVFSLGPLSIDDSIAVVQACLEEAEAKNGFKTPIEKNALDLLCTLSEGYPHFLQQFCYCAFDADSDNLISVDDVRQGTYGPQGALDQLGRKFFQELYFDQIGSEDYRTVLKVMAEHSDNWVTRTDLLSLAGLKDHTISNAIQALKNKNIILANENQKGSYRLPTRSFAAWIKALNTDGKAN